MRTYQIIKDTIPAGATSHLTSARLKNEYDRATGIFFFSEDLIDSYEDLTCRLTIGDQEIFPKGTDCKLMAYSSSCSRNDAIWDLQDEDIPAKDSLLEAYFTNNSGSDIDVSIYVLLEN